MNERTDRKQNGQLRDLHTRVTHLDRRMAKLEGFREGMEKGLTSGGLFARVLAGFIFLALLVYLGWIGVTLWSVNTKLEVHLTSGKDLGEDLQAAIESNSDAIEELRPICDYERAD